MLAGGNSICIGEHRGDKCGKDGGDQGAGVACCWCSSSWLRSRRRTRSSGWARGRRRPLAAAAVVALPARSCLIDGEASGARVFEPCAAHWAESGGWTTTADGDWTGGFWPGIHWLAYQHR